jgi:CheY-like chemotaxis protein
MTDLSHLILVVDDDPDVRDVMKDVLHDEGFEVAFAADGEEALRYLRGGASPCLILLDWMMPRCDGATFRERQLADPRFATVPVVLLTADARTEQKKDSLGIARILKKPVRFVELVDVLDSYCKRDAS